MAHMIETMFSVREKPWHDWTVVQEPVYTDNRELIKGYKANVRSSDRRVLGVVSDRYKVVQNTDAFSFTDELLGNGVK